MILVREVVGIADDSHYGARPPIHDVVLDVIPGIRIAESPFPKLWQQLRDQPDLLLPLARLQAIFLLKVSGTCEHILDLTLGPIRQNRLEVRFHGRRRKQYVNVDAAEIDVAGACPLLP